LAQGGATVRVFEQAQTHADIGAGIQISANAMHVFTALGLASKIIKAGFEPTYATLRHYQSGAIELQTPLKGAHETRYGHKYLHLHRADLLAILVDAALEAGVDVLFGRAASGYTQNASGIRLECDGEDFVGDILIGADGIKSTIRETMHGEENARFTGQVAWRGLVAASEPLIRAIAPDATIWLGPGQHFVSYYVRGGELINFVAVKERDQWTEESWRLKGDVGELKRTFAGWHPSVQAILDACQECFLWGLFDRPQLPCWSDGRAVLLGDACHPMQPFMAQGAAMAVEDAFVLSQQILHNAMTDEPLSQYERLRKPRATMLQTASRENAKLFHASSPIARAARQTKFKIASAIPSLANSRLDRIYAVNVTEDK
jgi:salicylate hydroxylase